MKTMVVVCKKTRAVLCVFCCSGKTHDFRLFKESGIRMSAKTQAEADTAFTGIHRYHKNSFVPKKTSKRNPLTHEDKLLNRMISSERVTNEHAIGFLKRFKILSERYRNRRKRFGLRFHLIAGICNFDLLF
jgi:hypothetical protein